MDPHGPGFGGTCAFGILVTQEAKTQLRAVNGAFSRASRVVHPLMARSFVSDHRVISAVYLGNGGQRRWKRDLQHTVKGDGEVISAIST